MLALSSFHCQASHSTVVVHLPGSGAIEGAQTYESLEVWAAMRRALKVTLGADTYHDLQPTCAVGVMRAVSSPWQGATRRIGNSPGSAVITHAVFLTLCPVLVTLSSEVLEYDPSTYSAAAVLDVTFEGARVSVDENWMTDMRRLRTTSV